MKVLCFSGTKSGVTHGEAVVFFDRELSAEFVFRCKQAGWLFHSFIGVGGSRFMCNWSTTEAAVDRLVADMIAGAGG